MKDYEILIEILKRQRNEALDAMALMVVQLETLRIKKDNPDATETKDDEYTLGT